VEKLLEPLDDSHQGISQMLERPEIMSANQGGPQGSPSYMIPEKRRATSPQSYVIPDEGLGID
jgi:hypothetical protein